MGFAQLCTLCGQMVFFLALMSGLFFLHFYFDHQSLLDNKLFKLLVKLKDRYYFAAFCRGERNKYQ